MRKSETTNILKIHCRYILVFIMLTLPGCEILKNMPLSLKQNYSILKTRLYCPAVPEHSHDLEVLRNKEEHSFRLSV